MYIEFKLKEKSSDGRKYLICYHHTEIKSIKTICGGECVWLCVNGLEVEGSYEYLVKLLTEGLTKKERNNCFGRYFTIYGEL